MEGLDADPAVLVPAAQKGLGLQGNHEGYLKALVAVQDELAAAVKSPGGGQAIQTTMFSAWEKGKALSQSLQEILQTLLDGAKQTEAADLDIASQIKSMNDFASSHGATSLGTDGTNSNLHDMTQTGTYHGQAVGKVNTLW
ncbi:hypothetical protein OH799_31460 [Nocardia sp. NBC_00881]|uniref:hypothetical protein n=1 Tax=Nocardia sp. NBC_00881 TaxID=2975995 RepID=UPI0038675F30|nr:hypothetical protein OH799_31460 [Nocardia sp. NBC_00881]